MAILLSMGGSNLGMSKTVEGVIGSTDTYKTGGHSNIDENVCTQPTPSMEQKLSCGPDKRGHCRAHGDRMKTQMISSKKWGDRGGGRGYSWKYSRGKKYICQAAVEATKTLGISDMNPNPYDEEGEGDRFGDFTARGGTTTTLCDVEDRITRYTGDEISWDKLGELCQAQHSLSLELDTN